MDKICFHLCGCISARQRIQRGAAKATSGSQIHYRTEPPTSSHRGVNDLIVCWLRCHNITVIWLPSQENIM